MSCIHRCNRSIDLAPVIDASSCLNARFRTFFSPVDLVAHPADIQLFIESHKLGISVYRCEAVRTVCVTGPAATRLNNGSRGRYRAGTWLLENYKVED